MNKQFGAFPNLPACSLVLGGHINGYSIVKELFEEALCPVVLFDYGPCIARYSNKVVYKRVIDKTPDSLLREIKKLGEKFQKIVVFPTDDLQLINLNIIHEDIKSYCYLPFNPRTLLQSSDKFFQYKLCAKLGIPFPRSFRASSAADLNNISNLAFPILIKPLVRDDLNCEVFRNMYIDSMFTFSSARKTLLSWINKGVKFLVSEYVPGDDTNIYAYTCFRSQEGLILNEWTGKKLTQYPDNYCVFCSSSNEAPEKVLTQGRKLVKALDIYGIVEPEFKYDMRDQTYKLMEVNLRSMMWHRTGSISNVKLQKTQYCYALGKSCEKYQQIKDQRIHFVLMLHEIPNLISRKGYWRFFVQNLFDCDKRVWAVFEWHDLLPFFFSLKLLLRKSLKVLIDRLI